MKTDENKQPDIPPVNPTDPNYDAKAHILWAISKVFKDSQELENSISDMKMLLENIESVEMKEIDVACLTGSNAMTYPCSTILGFAA